MFKNLFLFVMLLAVATPVAAQEPDPGATHDWTGTIVKRRDPTPPPGTPSALAYKMDFFLEATETGDPGVNIQMAGYYSAWGMNHNLRYKLYQLNTQLLPGEPPNWLFVKTINVEYNSVGQGAYFIDTSQPITVPLPNATNPTFKVVAEYRPGALNAWWPSTVIADVEFVAGTYDAFTRIDKRTNELLTAGTPWWKQVGMSNDYAPNYKIDMGEAWNITYLDAAGQGIGLDPVLNANDEVLGAELDLGLLTEFQEMNFNLTDSFPTGVAQLPQGGKLEYNATTNKLEWVADPTTDSELLPFGPTKRDPATGLPAQDQSILWTLELDVKDPVYPQYYRTLRLWDVNPMSWPVYPGSSGGGGGGGGGGVGG